MVRIKRKFPAGQTLEITLENHKKSFLEHFAETPISSKIVYLENVSTFTGKKYLRRRFFLNSVASFQPGTLLEKTVARFFS